MASHAPGRGVIEVGGSEGVKTEGGGVLVDVLDDSLQGVEVLDVINAVTGLLNQVCVHDDAIGLIAEAGADQTTIGILVGVVGGGEGLLDIGAGEVHGAGTPLLDAGGGANVEQRGGVSLVHLGGHGLLVGAGRGSLNLDLNVGVLLHVGLGEGLGGLIKLGLEVEPVDVAGTVISAGAAGVRRAGAVAAGAATAASEAKDRRRRRTERDELLPRNVPHRDPPVASCLNDVSRRSCTCAGPIAEVFQAPPRFSPMRIA